MRKKIDRTKRIKKAEDIGIFFEPLEPRLLLSGSLATGVGGPSSDSPSGSTGSIEMEAVTLSEGSAHFGSEALLRNQHALGAGTFIDVLANAPVLDTFEAENGVDTVPETSTIPNETSPSTEAAPTDGSAVSIGDPDAGIDPIQTTITAFAATHVADDFQAELEIPQPVAEPEDDAPIFQDTQAEAESITGKRHELAFVDTQVKDYQHLIDDLKSQSNERRQIEVVLLDAGRDGIQQITDVLQNRYDIDAVHIFSHGVDGAVELGDAWLNTFSLEARADDIAQWKTALSADADILLYGCNVAAGAEGQEFIDRLGQLTGADVAASEDATGNTALGADWNLEYTTGSIETLAAIDAQTQQDWAHVMAITTGNSTFAGTGASTTASSLTWSHTVDSGSNGILIVSISIRDSSGGTVDLVTYGGTALTRIGFDASDKDRAEMWYLKDPAADTADIVVTLTTAENFVAGATNFFGVDQTAPYGSLTTGNGSGDPSLNVASAAGELVVDVASDRDVDSESIGADQGALWVLKNGSASNDAWGGSSTEAGAAWVTMSWTTTGAGAGEWAAVAVSLKPVINADEPVTNNVPGAQATDEDLTFTFNSANGNLISISDDAGEILTVTLSVDNGILNISQTTGLTFTSGANGTTTMTVTGSVEDINAALDGLQYAPTADYAGTDTLTIISTEGEIYSLNIDADLVGYYEFANADPMNDGSPAGSNDGILVGGATIANDPARGDVLSLDGSGDAVQIAGLFGGPANVTLAAWVNLTAANTDGAEVISLGDNVTLRLDKVGSGAGVEAFFHDGTTWQGTNSSQYLAGTGWHHVAYTFDDAANVQRLYIDGVNVATTNYTESIVYDQGPNTYIGINANGDPNYDFNGLIDDARIYSRALTAAEVASLANAPAQVSDTDTVSINVASVNDAPIRTAGTVNNLIVAEDSGLTSLGLGGVTYSPGGGSDESGQTLSYQVTAIPSDTLGDIFLSNGTTRVTIGSYTLAEIQGMQFRPADNASGTTAFQFNVYDSGGIANGGVDNISQFVLITVNPVNDAPTVDLNGSDGGGNNFTATFTEDAGAVNVTDSDAIITDVDDTTYLSLSVNLTGFSWDGANEHIIIGGYTFTYGSGIGDPVVCTVGSTNFSIDFDGSGFNVMRDGGGMMPVADLQTLTRGITYENISQNPTSGDRVINFIAQDALGLVGPIATSTISVVPENDTPAVTASAGTTVYTEQTAATVIDAGITLVDADGFDGVDPSDHYTAVVQITGNYEAADTLGFTNTANIQGVLAGDMLTLSVIGGQTATVADFEAALQSVTFYNGSDTPSELDRTISFSFDDGVDSSNITTKVVHVNAVNDSPTIATNTGATFDEGSIGNIITTAMLNEGDPDDSGAGLIYTLTGDVGNGTLRLNGTVLNTNDTFTQADIDAGIVTYDHDGSNTTGDSFDFSLTDGGENGSIPVIGTFSIIVTPVDGDAPVVVNNTGSTVLEGGTSTIISTELLFTDSEQPATNVTYTVTGGLANGQLELTTGPGVSVTSFTQDDIDNNRVVYVHDGSNTISDSFNFGVDDGQGNTLAGQSFSLTITPTNDTPTTTDIADVSVTEDAPNTVIDLFAAFADTEDADASPDLLDHHQHQSGAVYFNCHRRCGRDLDPGLCTQR